MNYLLLLVITSLLLTAHGSPFNNCLNVITATTTKEVPITGTEKRIIDKNFLMLMGRTYTGENFGTAEEWISLLKILSDQKGNLHSLKFPDILTHDFEKKEDLINAINQWFRLNNLEINVADAESIPKLSYKFRFELQPKDKFSIASNGFISTDEYDLLTMMGYHLIADPHDIVTHPQSLSDPLFYNSFQKQISLLLRTYRSVGMRNSRPKTGELDDYETANYALIEFLLGFFRDSFHENWTYLDRNNGGKLFLFGQGNSYFNAMIGDYIKGDLDSMADDLLSYLITETKITGKKLPADEIDHFPLIGNFKNSNPQRQQKYDQAMISIRELGATADTLPQAYEELKASIKNAYSYTFGDYSRSINIFLRVLGNNINRSTLLKKIFSKETRVNAYQRLIDFLIDYKNFIDLEYPAQAAKKNISGHEDKINLPEILPGKYEAIVSEIANELLIPEATVNRKLNTKDSLRVLELAEKTNTDLTPLLKMYLISGEQNTSKFNNIILDATTDDRNFFFIHGLSFLNLDPLSNANLLARPFSDDLIIKIIGENNLEKMNWQKNQGPFVRHNGAKEYYGLQLLIMVFMKLPAELRTKENFFRIINHKN